MTKKKAPEPKRAPAYLRQGYKTSTRTYHPEGEHGYARGTQTEHWSGQLDANARPEPVRMKVDRRQERD